MKQIVRKGTVKGSVLFTVVTVMLVMVTFLMTTLVLTTSAKRRAHYSYYETQAQYAAQAALNSITARAYNDPQFHRYLLDTVTVRNVQHEMTVDFRDTDIQFTNFDETTNTGTVTCWVERVDDQHVWDDVTHAIHSQPAWKITATANVGRGRNESEFTLCKTVYERFQANVDNAGAPVFNSVANSVLTYNKTLGNPGGGGGTPVRQATSPGLLSLSNQGVGNNGIWLGPQYSNLQTLPVGRTHYYALDDASDEAKAYWLKPANDNYGTGNVIYVNNLYVNVMDSIMFQHQKEGAVIYGDVMVNDANRMNKGIHFNSDIIDGDKPESFQACNYVYIDGTFTITSSGGAFIGTQHGGNRGTHPVNLFCGAVNCENELTVYGDTVLYDPALSSSWRGTDENTALLNFTGSNINKNPGTSYADDVTGNLICNNSSLTLSNMTINGDLVYANPAGSLSLSGVTVKGELISAVQPTVTGGSIDGGQSVGAAAYNRINDAYYTKNDEDATDASTYRYKVDHIAGAAAQSSGRTTYDYSLMPYHLRIDEIFQNYYRWDLQCTSADDCWKFINNGSTDTPDPLIDESEAAGHNWAPVSIGGKWVPGTSQTKGLHIIPTHKYYSPDTVIQSLTGSSALDITSLAQFQTFAGGADKLPDNTSTLLSKNKVVIAGHNQTATVTTSDLNLKARIVKESCTIDLSNINDWGSDGSLLFIDPSTSSDPLYIVLKGSVQGGNLGENGFFIMVNNTAYYGGDDYESPTAYAASGHYPANKEVYIFLDSSFKVNNKFYMITSGTYAQLMAADLNIVQKPLYPGDAGFDTLDPKIRYAYELVPNYSVFANAQTYTFGGCGFLNADLVMPRTKLHFASLNMGNQSVVYREDVDTNPWKTGGNSDTSSSGSVDGNSYLCGIGAFLLEEIDAVSVYGGEPDRKGMFAYVGGAATPSPSPTPSTTSTATNNNWNGTNLGEVHVPYFDDMYESPS
ncbi:MAG: hypothetical protein K5705_11330 [Oscillospiraceae bacterium]|nr:hypothetical protein [Oscillospiraceae bacterium]